MPKRGGGFAFLLAGVGGEERKGSADLFFPLEARRKEGKRGECNRGEGTQNLSPTNLGGREEGGRREGFLIFIIYN